MVQTKLLATIVTPTPTHTLTANENVVLSNESIENGAIFLLLSHNVE